MNTPRPLTRQQTQIIRELLSTVHPDFARTIETMLNQQLQTTSLPNPVAYVRSAVLAVRAGRHGPNRGLHIYRTRSAVRQHDSLDQAALIHDLRE